jgi:thymidine phosphorylase
LQPGEAGLSESTWTDLHAKKEMKLVFHVQPVTSMRSIRAKMYGKELNYEALQNIINDIVKGEYSNEIAFITACGGDNLNIQEIIGLTKAMVGSGQSLSWNKKMVVDKHCLPGNRTTLVVSIVAAFGLDTKTSSRAITSQALQTV